MKEQDHDVKKAAQDMLELYLSEEDNILYRRDVIDYLEREFLGKFLRYNKNGNVALARNLLAQFGKLTPELVYSQRGDYWRKREPGDPVGRKGD
jgi:hypothetical protein